MIPHFVFMPWTGSRVLMQRTVFQKLGNKGILKLMEDEKDRDAHFETAIAYADISGIRVFRGTMHGTIVYSPGKRRVWV